MEYYEKMKQIRIKNQLTQRKIAEKMMISQQHYQQYERGIHEIPLHYFRDFCIITGCSADELLELDRRGESAI